METIFILLVGFLVGVTTAGESRTDRFENVIHARDCYYGESVFIRSKDIQETRNVDFCEINRRCNRRGYRVTYVRAHERCHYIP